MNARRGWLAVIAVAVGTFAMVTVESLPVGLLTAISGALHISPGTAGLMVTVPGLVAAATAPLLPVVIRRLDRRIVLLGLMALMVLATLLSAVANGFPVLLASRFLAGVSIGGFWALAASVAVRLVSPQHMGRATSLAFGGATAANVLGVPAGTLLGELTGWRASFLAVAGLGLLVALALLVLLPPLPATSAVSVGTLVSQLRNPAIRVAVLATFLLVGGHWAAFTFVSPLLQSVSGVPAAAIGPVQLGFGVAGILGTFLAGVVAGRDVRAAVAGSSLLLAAVLALFPLAGGTPVTGIGLVLLWGLAFGGVPVGVQMLIFKAAPDAAEAASALNTSVFNLAIALGALFGGIVVDTVTLTGVLWLGAALTVLTTLVVLRARVGRPLEPATPRA
ncbi:MFS transporter [Nonomuraea sediminis]|uniref:MFS transporter n=1 Tax=Nonomuraea sediminis TaxID=2835864 RepID=UPI0027E0C1E2|nr:MFS transporter [Nonomuraea sediminis]